MRDADATAQIHLLSINYHLKTRPQQQQQLGVTDVSACGHHTPDV